MTTRAAGRAGRPPAVAKWRLFVRASASSGRRGKRQVVEDGESGRRGQPPPRSITREQVPLRASRRPRACRRGGQPFDRRSGFVAGSSRSPGQQLRQLLHALDLLQEILHVGALDRTLLEPARDPPVEGGGRLLEMLRYRGLEFRFLVEQRRHNPVSRPACQSGSRCTGSDGTSQPRYTARMTPRSSTSLRSQRSRTRFW